MVSWRVSSGPAAGSPRSSSASPPRPARACAWASTCGSGLPVARPPRRAQWFEVGRVPRAEHRRASTALSAERQLDSGATPGSPGRRAAHEPRRRRRHLGRAIVTTRPAPRPVRGRPFTPFAPGGWRDLVTLLHPPYTAWHLTYVALGRGAAPAFHAIGLLATLAAFFLAVGISAHSARRAATAARSAPGSPIGPCRPRGARTRRRRRDRDRRRLRLLTDPGAAYRRRRLPRRRLQPRARRVDAFTRTSGSPPHGEPSPP